MPKYTLTVNENKHQIETDSDKPLLWVLREDLKLTGSKFGCGFGICGACTVHLNGKATRSCILPVSEAAGGKIVTIEGLSKDGSHPLQKAWMEENVPQCGYCQAGQIMQAADLLSKNSLPSDEEINEAMKENLCRCGTYLRIRKAIHRAAKETKKNV
jgi:isoquinoline 1-oxidoreductase subunit alpha